MFTAVHHLANHTVPQIFNAFKEIFTYYLQRGFRITTIGMDGEFSQLKPLIAAMPGRPHINLTIANEHVPNIERRIRVVKERCCAIRHGLPFQRITQLMVIHMVLLVVRIINYFQPKGGVSTHISPKTIMSGKTLDYKKIVASHSGNFADQGSNLYWHQWNQPKWA